MWENPATYAAIFSGITTVVVVIMAYRAIKGQSHSEGIREGRVDAFMEKVEQFMTEIRGELAQVKGDIKNLFLRLPVDTVGTNSPRVLTDFGKEVSKLTDADKWGSDHSQNLANEIEGKEEFEIELLAIQYVKEQYENSEAFRRIVQKCAYGKGINTDKVNAVFEIELRDALLKKI